MIAADEWSESSDTDNEYSPSTPRSDVIVSIPEANEMEVDSRPQISATTIPNSCHSDIPVYDSGNFEEVYASSIKQPLRIVEEQFEQLLWNEAPVQVHQPDNDDEIWL